MRRAGLATVTACLTTAGAALLGVALARQPGGIPPAVTGVTLYSAPLALAFAVVGAAILRRRPDHPVGWSLGLLGATIAAGIFTEGYAAWDLPGLDWLIWGWMLLNGVTLASLAAALLLFPTGTPPGPRWRWLRRVLVLYVVASALISAFAPWPRKDGFVVLYVMEWRGWPSTHPVGWTGPPWLADLEQGMGPLGVCLVLLAAASVGPRWRRAAGEERQQLKWLALTVLVVVLVLSLGLSQAVLGPEQTGSNDLVGTAIFTLVIASVPVAMGLAIVRYHLYDIDTIISRTLAFGGMAVLLAAAYLVAVVLGGQVVGHFGEFIERPPWLSAGSSTSLAVAATAAVALTFDLIRRRLQGLADRMVFGARAKPYELLTRLGSRLSAAVAPSEVLVVIAEAAARAVRGRAATVTASLTRGETLTASWPTAASTFDLSVPVRDGDRVLGDIRVTAGGARPADAVLLRDVAAVATSALRNLHLDAELTSLRDDIDRRSLEVVASRRRLEEAERTERQRLAQAVAARIGPNLEALRAALACLGPQPSRTDIEMLGDQAAHLVDEVRALSRGILPAVLADHGLVAALRARLRRLDARATLDVDASLVDVRLPEPIETTAYLVFSDLITEASGAVSVRLWRRDGRLAFEVSQEADDPLSIPTIAADRLAALGGELRFAAGTGLVGGLPLR